MRLFTHLRPLIKKKPTELLFLNFNAEKMLNMGNYFLMHFYQVYFSFHVHKHHLKLYIIPFLDQNL